MELPSQSEVLAPSSNRVLVVMAKAPRPGAVKTRLTPSLTIEAITALYHCLLQDTLALALSLPRVDVAVMCPESDVIELAGVADHRARVIAQQGDGLAAGLTSVFAAFARNHQERIIAFNSDSPHLPLSVLETAFETLTSRDLVVGPTHDGGYYLVGAKASHPTLFAGEGMGTGAALDTLLSSARLLNLSVGFVESFYDIDVVDDLIRLAPELQVAPERAPRTAGWFEEWGHSVAQLRKAAGEL